MDDPEPWPGARVVFTDHQSRAPTHSIDIDDFSKGLPLVGDACSGWGQSEEEGRGGEGSGDGLQGWERGSGRP